MEGSTATCAGREVVNSGEGNTSLTDAHRLPNGVVVCILEVESAIGEPGTLVAGQEVTRYRAVAVNENTAPAVLPVSRGIVVTGGSSSAPPHAIVNEMTSEIPDEIPGRSAFAVTVTDAIPFSQLDDYTVNQFGAIFWSHPDRQGR